jgi:hypothetical protein
MLIQRWATTVDNDLLSRAEGEMQAGAKKWEVYTSELRSCQSGHPRRPTYEYLVESEDKVLVDTAAGKLAGHYIEILAIGQAVGRSDDLQNLAREIRNRIA